MLKNLVDNFIFIRFYFNFLMDHLSNRLTGIRNGQLAKLKQVHFKFFSNTQRKQIAQGSTLRLRRVLELLRQEGYIRGFSFKTEISSSKVSYSFFIYLKYDTHRRQAIQAITRISTKGRRIYRAANALNQPYSTTGMYCLSTSQGLRTDKQARLLNLGGELLFSVKLCALNKIFMLKLNNLIGKCFLFEFHLRLNYIRHRVI